MSTRPPRLGDMIDDYCTRCRLLLNHAVVGMVGDEVKKVRCLTCRNEHPYRHGRGGKRKKDSVQALFEEVLRGMPSPDAAPKPPAAGKDEDPEGGEQGSL